jgi:hypothetical protein
MKSTPKYFLTGAVVLLAVVVVLLKYWTLLTNPWTRDGQVQANVIWLVVIFLGFSLLAPPNATTNLALMVSALCAAAAIFLILELDRPFGGLIQISSEPMRNAWSQLGKWGL